MVAIAKTPENDLHFHRAYSENSELISASGEVREIWIDQFDRALADLVEMTRSYTAYGDVALVPDGPKPLILAMSLVPLYLDIPGVYSWHVGHVKPDGYEPIDVESGAEIYGFTLR